MKKVSVIIPVYNVESYIDQCLESVCNQTYPNLEIILVYDESSDKSYEKCLWWIKKDTRIQMIRNYERKGLGAARNKALREATGKYVTFLDSDDWMEKDYIQRFYDFIEKYKVDFVSSCEWNIVEKEKIFCKRNFHEMIVEEKEKDILFHLFGTIWGNFFNREWMIKYKIFNPELFVCEDWATLPIMVLQSKRVGIMEGAGIFYRINREGALTDLQKQKNKISWWKDAESAFQYFLNYAKEYNLFEKYKLVLEKYCRRIYDSFLERCKESQDKEGLEYLEQIRAHVLQKYFPKIGCVEYPQIYLFGSFSLRWEFQQACSSWKECMKYFGFSSIISAVTPCKKIDVEHETIFRQSQVLQDITAHFLENIAQLQQKAVLLIDFVEERNDILEITGGKYCTYSEAFQETNVVNLYVGHIIRSGSKEFWDIWIKKCDILIALLKQYFISKNVILVKNRLSLVYKKKEKFEKFENYEKLIETNKMITQMEEYFLANYKGCTVIEVEERYFFTDKNFRYGCKPEYINDAFYEQISLKLYKQLIWKREHIDS